jgi:predicted dehydrogenase
MRPHSVTAMNKSNKVTKIGVVGCGARMRSVLKRLLPQDPRLVLHGVFDIDPQAIEQAREKFRPEGLRAYPSMESLVTDPEIDWVMVGTWNRHHAVPVIAALEAGKNVFCEKPLATTLADSMAVRKAVQRSKRVFAFGLVFRYSPHFQRIHKLLGDGRIGELISFEFNETLRPGHGGYIFGNWRRRTEVAGSHILEKCCHDLDVANWLTGSIPIRVASFGGKRIFTPENVGLGEQIGLDSEGRSVFVEWPDAHRVDPFSGDADLLDHQVIILEYANGVRATFHSNCVAALPERRFYLLGTLGTLRADAYDGTISLLRNGRDTRSEDFSIGANPDGHGGGDSVLAAGLAATMLEGREPLAGIDEAVRSAAVALAIDEAQATGEVVDLRPYWEALSIL